MLFYSKTNAHHAFFDRQFFRDLKEAKFEPHSVYWSDQHDQSTYETPFNEFLDPPHWEHLRNDPTTKIFMFYADEYSNSLDLDMWAKTLIEQRINPDQFWIIVMDDNAQRWVVNGMKARGYEGFHIQQFNLLMLRVATFLPNRFRESETVKIDKRFSMLSRNYHEWRLAFAAELYSRNLLTEFFAYTFHAINPYGQIKYVTMEKLQKDLQDYGFDVAKLQPWLDGIPYSFDVDTVLDKLNPGTYATIQRAGIHLLIESHFDPSGLVKVNVILGHRKITVLHFLQKKLINQSE